MFATKTLFALTAIATLAAAGTANAGEFQSNGRTAVVRYSDINLADAAGRKELQRRVNVAAKRVCAHADVATMDACRDAALDHVVAPVSAVIARAASGDRYADAQDTQDTQKARAIVGN
jgi:UrcA family protein